MVIRHVGVCTALRTDTSKTGQIWGWVSELQVISQAIILWPLRVKHFEPGRIAVREAGRWLFPCSDVETIALEEDVKEELVFLGMSSLGG